MKRMAIGLALAIGLIASGVQAQDKAASSTLGVFTHTCGQFASSPDKLRAYLPQYFERMPSDVERNLLGELAGQGWRSTTGHEYRVFSLDDATCVLMTDDVSPIALREELHAMMAKLKASQDKVVTLLEDRKITDDLGEKTIVTYSVALAGAKHGVQYDLTGVRRADNNHMLVRLTSKPIDVP